MIIIDTGQVVKTHTTCTIIDAKQPKESLSEFMNNITTGRTSHAQNSNKHRLYYFSMINSRKRISFVFQILSCLPLYIFVISLCVRKSGTVVPQQWQIRWDEKRNEIDIVKHVASLYLATRKFQQVNETLKNSYGTRIQFPSWIFERTIYLTENEWTLIVRWWLPSRIYNER